jgi:Na+-driven multidrug efflux pump
VNIVLDPILIFGFGMGCAGAGAATAISQWCAVLPMLYVLNRYIPFSIKGKPGEYLADAFQDYFKAGSLILVRTIAKISAYSVTAAAAARLGSVNMAAYSLTFNLGFATSQLCEAVSIAAQALLARDVPFNTSEKKEAAEHVIHRSLLLGLVVSSTLAFAVLSNQEAWIAKLSKSPEVQAAALKIMPVVLITQLFKGLAYSTGGILLGGKDWFWSSLGMINAALVVLVSTTLIGARASLNLWNIWLVLCAFMATQVATSLTRILSGTGPWANLRIGRVRLRKIFNY